MECVLRRDEILYFLHIPKTAGGTLTLILDGFFHESEIFPAQLLSDFVRVSPLKVALSSCRFLRGHFDFAPLSIINEPIRVITLLREPHARCLSQLAHMLRHPEVAYWDPRQGVELDWSSLLWSPLSEQALGNVQLKSLVSDWIGFAGLPRWDIAAGVTPDPTLVEIAIRRLDTFSAVGIQERFEDFFRWLRFLLGFPRNTNQTRCNTSESARRWSELDTADQNRIRDLNKLDQQLYEYAQRRFELDYSQMLRTLDAQFPEHRGDVDTQLDLHVERLGGRDTQSEDAATADAMMVRHFDFQQPLRGTNWYTRERGLGRTFRWTGPENVSTLELILPAGNMYAFCIDTLGAVTLESLDSFRLSINGVM
ncbi:MAG: hypothetical protein O2931_13900, partial [Planctomycetota bacterium]|nr:hypothetical protein [Planctomycetota bacterium]